MDMPTSLKRPKIVVRGGVWRNRIRAALLVTVIGIPVAARAQEPGTDDVVTGTTAVARPAPLFLPDGTPERLDFKFGDTKEGEFKAWLRHKGGWEIDGWVQHAGLLCATYRVGVRFGAGKPGCTDVQWLTDVVYATEQRQCNNASMRHIGGDVSFSLGKDFARVTCAERIINCRGNCR